MNRSSTVAAAACAAAAALSGCASTFSYIPQDRIQPGQSIRFTQGVGTITVVDTDTELFVYPTFKLQDIGNPTFTLGYKNLSAGPVNFGPANVKAFFRDRQFGVYTYEDRIAEIRAEKRGQQVGLALLGGIAAGAAAYSMANQRSTYQYSSTSPYGTYNSFATLRTYDPAAGLLAGGAIAGVTAVGVRQLANTAQGREAAANSVLQDNTVDPGQIVSGELIVRDCCELPYGSPDNVIRLEITVGTKTYAFHFARREAK